jgi:DNA-binding MarR family transcriptional regulator
MVRHWPLPEARFDMSAVTKQRLRLWLRMLRATRRVENELRERLRTGHDTTMPRFDVLAALYRRPEGLKMSALSRMLMVSNGNVTGLIERLVEDGYVQRNAVHGDRRATEVQLTASGTQYFERLAAEHEGWVNDILNDISEDEARALFGPLERLARMGEHA